MPRRSTSWPWSSSGRSAGTVPAVITAVASFLVYDLLFTEPRFSLAVTDTSELLNLVLVLIVALAVGRLAALGRERAAEADRRAVEATGLFAVSRLLATADSTEDVAGPIVDRLAREAGLTRVWIKLEGAARERILADTGEGPVCLRSDRDHAGPNAWRRARALGPRPRATPPGWRHAPRQRRRPHPGADRDRRERIRVALGGQARRDGIARRRSHPAPLTGGRSAGPRPSTRPSARRGHQRRGRPTERRPQERTARLGLARPADATGQHPRHGRQPGRPGPRLVEWRGAPGRGDDRRRGAAPRSLRPVGARPQPHRVRALSRPDLEVYDLPRAPGADGDAFPTGPRRARRSRWKWRRVCPWSASMPSCSMRSSRTSSTTSPITRRPVRRWLSALAPLDQGESA